MFSVRWGWALGFVPFFGPVAIARLHARDRGRRGMLHEAGSSPGGGLFVSTLESRRRNRPPKIRFRQRYEALLGSLEKARKVWTAVRVGRAGPSARSSQLLALIENAAQLSNVAVALHEQMLYVSTYPKFAEVSKEIAREKIELVRVIQLMAAGIIQRGANVDLRDLVRADALLGEAVEKLRSATYTEIHDYSILVHVGKLSRSFKSILDLVANQR